MPIDKTNSVGNCNNFKGDFSQYFKPVLNNNKANLLFDWQKSNSDNSFLKWCNFDVANLQEPNKVNLPTTPNCQKLYTNKFNVTKELFNGNAEDLNRCLKGTKLEGQGQMFIDTQEKYGINAIFLMAIARLESGYGNKPQKNPYSIFGTGDRTSKSYAKCLDKLSNNLKQNYISKNNLETISAINKRYSPENPQWSIGIAKSMTIISKQIMAAYQ